MPAGRRWKVVFRRVPDLDRFDRPEKATVRPRPTACPSAHYFVPVDQIDWIDSAENYLQLHVGDRAHLARGTLKEAEEELDPNRFVRIHRSTIVAIDRVQSLRRHESGVHIVQLRTGAKLRSSRQYADRVRKLLR